MAHSDPSRILCAQIDGVAWGLVRRGLPTPGQRAAAVDELRQLAGDRADLLAEVAGVGIGFGESQPGWPWYRQVADLCIAAGARQDQIPAWIPVGRLRAEQASIAPNTGGRQNADSA